VANENFKLAGALHSHKSSQWTPRRAVGSSLFYIFQTSVSEKGQGAILEKREDPTSLQCEKRSTGIHHFFVACRHLLNVIKQWRVEAGLRAFRLKILKKFKLIKMLRIQKRLNISLHYVFKNEVEL
jgi:hypothetical protein